MPKLTDEDQCMLNMMEITGFPMEIKHGLYTWDRYLESRPGQISRTGLVSTADFSRVTKVFERWKEERNED